MTKEVVIHEGILTFNYLFPFHEDLHYDSVDEQSKLWVIDLEYFQGFKVFFFFSALVNDLSLERSFQKSFCRPKKRDDASLLIMMMQVDN